MIPYPGISNEDYRLVGKTTFEPLVSVMRNRVVVGISATSSFPDISRCSIVDVMTPTIRQLIRPRTVQLVMFHESGCRWFVSVSDRSVVCSRLVLIKRSSYLPFARLDRRRGKEQIVEGLWKPFLSVMSII